MNFSSAFFVYRKIKEKLSNDKRINEVLSDLTLSLFRSLLAERWKKVKIKKCSLYRRTFLSFLLRRRQFHFWPKKHHRQHFLYNWKHLLKWTSSSQCSRRGSARLTQLGKILFRFSSSPTRFLVFRSTEDFFPFQCLRTMRVLWSEREGENEKHFVVGSCWLMAWLLRGAFESFQSFFIDDNPMSALSCKFVKLTMTSRSPTCAFFHDFTFKLLCTQNHLPTL